MNAREIERRQVWLSRISDLEDSGLHQIEWCNRRGIPESTLRYWKKKLAQEAAASDSHVNWMKVEVTDSPVAQLRAPEPSAPASITTNINIKYGDFTVELPSTCDPQRVFELLRMLKAL